MFNYIQLITSTIEKTQWIRHSTRTVHRVQSPRAHGDILIIKLCSTVCLLRVFDVTVAITDDVTLFPTAHLSCREKKITVYTPFSIKLNLINLIL